MRSLALLALLLVFGCARTHYQPSVVARAELVLRHGAQLEMWAGGKRVARGLAWRDLGSFVRCVPDAKRHAVQARADGRTSLALAILGGSLGALSLSSLAGVLDEKDPLNWIGTGIVVAGLGVAMAGSSIIFRNSANGHAVDALNLYNDAVGSIGASCDE